jgi:hypothetical protein
MVPYPPYPIYHVHRWKWTVEVDALAYGFIFEITPAHEDLTSTREIYRDDFKLLFHKKYNYFIRTAHRAHKQKFHKIK